MKKVKYAVALMALVFWSCDGGTATPSLQEEAVKKLSGTWNTGVAGSGSVVIDGKDQSVHYSGFSLTLGNQTYTTTNAGQLFAASGTWRWSGAEKADKITLSEGKELTIKQLTANRLVFEFNLASAASERAGISGVSGNYTITLSK